MKLIRAKVLGFCMGVRRAVDTAQAAAAKAVAQSAAEKAESACIIYTLGPLIHNPQVLDSFAGQGIRILEEERLFTKEPPDLSGATVIIRAHGIDPGTEQKLRERGARIVDATCPRVKASQLIALKMAEKGYRIFLAGESDHAELKGIYGYAMEGAALYRAAIPGAAQQKAACSGESCVIVGNPQDAKAAAGALLEMEPLAETALIGQTTISEDEYKMIAEAIKEVFPNLEVKNTICQATRERQNALRELCSQVDAVIIAGGKDSANTRRLLSIAESCGKKAWLVESAGALPPLDEMNTTGISTIGISAGASTPDSVIAEIESALCQV